jgi:hypothetical protein
MIGKKMSPIRASKRTNLIFLPSYLFAMNAKQGLEGPRSTER